MKLSQQALERPKVVLLATLCLAVAGLICLWTIPIELTPKIDVPVFFVVVPYPGAAPEDVETYITKDLEKKLNTIKSLDFLSSISSEGVSTVIVRLQEESDLKEARQDLRHLVESAEVDFPEEAEPAIIENIDFTNIPLVFITLHGKTSPFVLKEWAKKFQDDIEAIDGVSEVHLFGGQEREIQVRIHPEKLKEYQLSLAQIEDALRSQHLNFPGGYLQVGQQEFLIRTVGEFQKIEDIENTVVSQEKGQVLLLKHLGEVQDTYKKLDTIARLNGEPGVTLIVQREVGINTIQTVNQIRKKTQERLRELPQEIHCSITFDQSDEIRVMIQQLGSTVLYGSFIVCLCLMLVMGIINALLVCCAIPISLLFGFICMLFADVAISGITLFSLILIMGMVVDGAIIVIENIYRHVEKGLQSKEAAKIGIHEIGEAVISADLTTVSAFLPMVFIVGVMGQFLAIMPQVVAFTLLGSMLADHFLLPVLASYCMRKKTIKADKEFWGLALFRKVFQGMLRLSLRFPKLLLFLSVLSIAFTGIFVFLGFLGYEFIPEIDRGRFSINFELPKGTPIEKTDEVARFLENEVQKIPSEELENYVTTVGNTNKLNADVLEGGGSGPEFGKITVQLVDPRKRQRTLTTILNEYRQSVQGKLPGVRLHFYVQKDGPPVGAAMAIRIQGEDLKVLGEVSIQIEALLRTCPGAEDIQNDFIANSPQLQIQVHRIQAGSYGLNARQIASEVSSAFLGKEVGKMTLRGEKVEIRLQLDSRFCKERKHIEQLYLRSSQGHFIPLAQVAEVSEISAPASIHRRNLKRTITVRCETTSDWSSDDLLLWLQKEMKTFPLPSGIQLEMGGETEERDKSLGSARGAMGISILLIFLILTIQFNSFTQPLLILATIPLSLIGVVFGLYFLDLKFGFMPFIGIISLTGIVVNDAIVLVDFTNQLRATGLSKKEAILLSAEQRLRAVLLTTITTVGGLLPLALNWGGGGLFWVPLAWSIICGISVATLLTLVVIPVLYFLLVPENEVLCPNPREVLI